MKFAIPKPCHEDWNKMQPEEKGAFCNACSKVVVDFSAMSDEELIAYFDKHKNEKLCGRFKSTQLANIHSHTFKLSETKIIGGFKGAFLVSCFAAFTSLFILTGCDTVKGEPMPAIDLRDTITFIQDIDTATVTAPADTIQEVEEILMGKPAMVNFPLDTVAKEVKDTLPTINMEDYPIMGIMVPTKFDK